MYKSPLLLSRSKSDQLSSCCEDIRTTAKITTTSSLPHTISAKRILATLHDHSLLMELNPLVKSHHLLNPTSPQEAQDSSTSKCTYRITERLSYLPFHLWDSEITFTATFQDTELGLITKVSAPLGVEMNSEWKLLTSNERRSDSLLQRSVGNGIGEEEEWILQETATVSCSMFMMPFVKTQIKQSRGNIHQRFRQWLESAQE